MVFSDFVESVVETPICCELKQHLDKLYEIYSKDPENENLASYFRGSARGSAKSDFLILLPFFLTMDEEENNGRNSEKDAS